MNADEVKRNVAITDLIERAGLHPTGHGHVLSTEEHDSLKIWPDQNSYYWYSQGHGGSVIDWIMHTDRVDTGEAIRRLEAGDFRPAPVFAPTPPRPTPILAPDLHLAYHRALDAAARDWWHGEGITDEAISRFFLGVCDYHPAWRQTTYTIPIIVDGRLVNIRHRLAAPLKPGDKYRPECAGIPASLFNGDILTPDQGGVIIVAGEKKAVVMWQYGLPAISSTAGCGTWKPDWTTALQFCRKVYLAYDPGESAAAWKTAAEIGERAFVVAVPDKPDDFLLAHGEQAFRALLRQAQPFADREYWRKRANYGRALWGRLLE